MTTIGKMNELDSAIYRLENILSVGMRVSTMRSQVRQVLQNLYEVKQDPMNEKGLVANLNPRARLPRGLSLWPHSMVIAWLRSNQKKEKSLGGKQHTKDGVTGETTAPGSNGKGRKKNPTTVFANAKRSTRKTRLPRRASDVVASGNS